jgi:hypothetical protein
MTARPWEQQTLFDVTTIPSRQIADPTLALAGERWCSGSGVPGDNCAFGHPVLVDFDEEAWRPVGLQDVSRKYARAMCRRCEITRRNYRDSLDDGDRAKARAWISGEARKYARLWGCTTAEARYRFELHGVTVDYMSELFRRAKAQGTCPDWRRGGCGEAFAPGPHDVTGDIKDPSEVALRGYLLCDDIHAQCFTCNRSKGDRQWTAWLRTCAFFHHCSQYEPPGTQVPLG